MRCLVIEDEMDTARYICNGLKEAGFNVHWCRNSVDGLHLAADENWDVVILDRLLPGNSDGLSIVQTMRTLRIGGVLAVVIAVGGAILFRNQLERRVAAIRHTVVEIEAGDLDRRIPVLDSNDEFTRLNYDINHMLDQIQHLMEGVRNISNAIAHDLRTPLGRILLDEALRQDRSPEKLSTAATNAIRQIDDLTVVFDKLLQIAEAESGTRRQSFEPVALKEIVTDVVEFYDAAAEAKGIRLTVGIEGEPTTLGDKDLLASATANLVDNALKYAGSDSTIRVRAVQDRNTVSIVVQDNGPGIPAGQREKVMTRFYRGDQSRTLPGNGLGLPIVSSISQLHSGIFALEDASPGLTARIVLPRVRTWGRGGEWAKRRESARDAETGSRISNN
jgi:signal transduction histidine kinase